MANTLTETELADLIQKATDQEKFTEAEQLLRVWLNAKPDSPVVWNNLGLLYRKSGRFEAARSVYEYALSLAPDNPKIYSSYGNLLCHLGEMEQSIAFLRKAHALAPDNVDFKQNLVFALRDSRQFDEAIKLQREINALMPDDIYKQFILGFILLHNRELEEGWELYEKRPRTPEQIKILQSGVTRYAGEALKGKSLLIVGEQGFGDTILMLRFIAKLQKQAKQIVLVSRKPLFPLIEPLGVECVDKDAIPADFDPAIYDYTIEIKSLIPLMGALDWCKWPKPPTLTVPEKSRAKYAFLKEPSRPGTSRLKVGIIWSGSVTFKYNNKRSVSYERFLKLMSSHPRIEFFSFQKGPREADIEEYGRSTLIPLGQTLDHFGDSAAALEHMDCILMTDSGIAHLAGTLGVPVINMLNFFHYWLYNPRAATSPLYGSMRLLHQPEESDWDTVFAKASEILGDLALESAKASQRLSRPRVLEIIDAKLQNKALYDPSRFKPETIEAKKKIILTGDTDQRWEKETPYFGDVMIKALKLTKKSIVLDYGVGIGRMAKYLIDTCGCKVIGVDISKDMLESSVEYVNSNRYEAMHVDEFVKTHKTLNVSAAYSIWVLQHCLEVEDIVQDISAAMKKNALLFIANTINRVIPVQGKNTWSDDGVDIRALVNDNFTLKEDLTKELNPSLPENHHGKIWCAVFKK